MYLTAFACLFLVVSAAVDTRPAAMLVCIGWYFLLVPFVLGVAPYMNLDTALGAIGSILGVGVSDALRNTIKSLTPYPAYGGVAEVVFSQITDQYQNVPNPDASGRAPLHTKLWFDTSVLLVWTVLSLLVGWRALTRTELE